jgi:GNAT superfamily N-acetyltransferase
MGTSVTSGLGGTATSANPLLGSARDARGRAFLMTGQPVDIRPAAPADLEAVRGFYARLGDTSTYYRFFGLRRRIPEGELRAVVGDSADHVTLLATIDHELIGIGEYIVGRRPTEAEVAFAVADDHHREGVATLLLERLAVIAHDRGLSRLTATVLPGNADMQLVFRTVGLPANSRFDDGVVEVVLELASLTSLVAASDARAEVSHAQGPCDDTVTQG